MYSRFLQTSATELFTKIISNVNIMLFNYSRIKFNFWRLTGPECGSGDAYNTVLKIQTAISPWQQLKVKSLHLKFSIYCSKIRGSLKQLSKISGGVLWNIFSESFFKFLSKYPRRSYFLVKFHVYSIFFWTTLEETINATFVLQWLKAITNNIF